MKTIKAPVDVVMEPVNVPISNKPLPYLPNELIAHIVHYVVASAYPDYLHNIPRHDVNTFPADQELFRHFAHRTKYDLDTEPRYSDGAVALASAAKALALVSTDWLQMTHAIYICKLREIRVMERAFWRKKRRNWHYTDEEAVVRAFSFQWEKLHECGYSLAEAELKVALRREESALRREENLRQANHALGEKLQEAETERMISLEREESVRQENAALKLRLRELEAGLEARISIQGVAQIAWALVSRVKRDLVLRLRNGG